MNETDLFRYKNLLLAKQQELSAGKSLAGSIPTAGEPRGDPADRAASETDSAMQMRLKQADSKLWVAIEDALTRIRQGRFGICEECGEPISKARLEAVPGPGIVETAKRGRTLEPEFDPRATPAHPLPAPSLEGLPPEGRFQRAIESTEVNVAKSKVIVALRDPESVESLIRSSFGRASLPS